VACERVKPTYIVTLAHVGGRTYVYRVLVGRRHLEDLGVDGRIIVIWILK